jgi:hypothetical protein
MEQGPSWEPDYLSASQKIPNLKGGSIPYLKTCHWALSWTKRIHSTPWHSIKIKSGCSDGKKEQCITIIKINTFP